MIKTILFLILLFAPAVSATPEVCGEILDVMITEGGDGYINEQEAKQIYDRCLRSFE